MTQELFSNKLIRIYYLFICIFAKERQGRREGQESSNKPTNPMKAFIKWLPAAIVTMVLAIACSAAETGNLDSGLNEELGCVSDKTVPSPLASLPSLPVTTGLDKAIVVKQSSGSDMCYYLFSQGDCLDRIYRYNIRLEKWEEVPLPDGIPLEVFKSAAPAGSSHIVLSGGEGGEDYLYHTITNTLVKAQDSSVEKKGFKPVDVVVMVLYFLALVLIGFYFSKRQKSSDDYFKGGQRIPWWAAGLSLFATALSAITFMSIPAKSYATDWSYMLFNAGIVLVCPLIIFLFIPFFRKLNISTAYEYLEIRFNKATRLICSIAFIVYQIGRMGVVLYLPSIAIHIVTGMNIFLCIGLMGIFSIIYTRMGGIEAVVWTDALQTIILLGGALFCVFHIIHSSGLGFSGAISTAAESGKFFMGSTKIDFTNASMWTVLIATVFTNITTYGTDQSMVQRYLSTPSEKAAKRSVLTNAVIVIPATLIFFTIGTLLFVFYKTHPAELSASMGNTDAIFPWYICSSLPAGLTGLLISGIFAAAMSTLSGSMNSAATAYVVDIRPNILGKAEPDKTR
ncbi:MAG: sodium:solute symporter, partial [Bacteroidales bacterium]|nr:sodium:solute symporter [Bacteroidales bacterium]